MFSQHQITEIASFLEPIKNNLHKIYSWEYQLKELKGKISDDDFKKLQDLQSQENFEKEVALKRTIVKYLNPTDLKNKNAFPIVNWIIKDWGGIKTGKELSPEQLESVISRKLLFERIASTSKIAAFMYPEDCIIYDSRVAYSLNWILLSKCSGAKYFPIPEGRNSKMMAFDMNVLIHLKHKNKFVTKEDEIPKNHVSKVDGDLFFQKNEAYSILNDLTKEINKVLWKDDSEKRSKLFYTEMLLFSIADTYVFKDIIAKTELTIK